MTIRPQTRGVSKRACPPTAQQKRGRDPTEPHPRGGQVERRLRGSVCPRGAFLLAKARVPRRRPCLVVTYSRDKGLVRALESMILGKTEPYAEQPSPRPARPGNRRNCGASLTRIRDKKIGRSVGGSAYLETMSTAAPTPRDSGAPANRGVHEDTTDSAIPVRVAILDDHDLFAQGMAMLLTDPGNAIEVIWTGRSAKEAITHARAIDVLILDVTLDDDQPSAAEIVGAFDELGVPTLLLSAMSTGLPLRRAIKSGASGYLPKNAPLDRLVAAVQEISSGEVVLSKEMAAALADTEGPNFSDREIQVLRIYAQGLPLKSVARRLDISVNTADTHLRRIKQKYLNMGLSAHNRADLLKWAMRDGIIDPPA